MLQDVGKGKVEYPCYGEVLGWAIEATGGRSIAASYARIVSRRSLGTPGRLSSPG